VARPYVIVNVAASVDGKIDTFERHGAAISSEADRARVDALRASVDAVMVGGHTVVDEDPRLTVKSAELRAERVARGLSENPAKVGVVSHLDLNPEGRFVTEGPARVIVFIPTIASDTTGTTLREERGKDADTTGTTLREERGEDANTVGTTGHQGQTGAGTTIHPERGGATEALLERGVEIFAIGDGRVDLPEAMRTLRELGIERVLVEGGGTLNFELLRLNLVDELSVYIAPMIFGGSSAPTLADGAGLSSEAARKLIRTDVQADDDGGVLLRYKVEPRE
jgi:riboflavin biosynthesis pyrimidine reductase